MPLLYTAKPVGAVTVKLPEDGTRYEPLNVAVLVADDVPVVVGENGIVVGESVNTGGTATVTL